MNIQLTITMKATIDLQSAYTALTSVAGLGNKKQYKITKKGKNINLITKFQKKIYKIQKSSIPSFVNRSSVIDELLRQTFSSSTFQYTQISWVSQPLLRNNKLHPILLDIETNPGPKKKNRGSVSDSKLPSFESLDRRFNRREIVRYVQKLERFEKQQRLGLIYKPEAFMEFGIDTESKEFFSSLLENLNSTLNETTLKHEIVLPKFTGESFFHWLTSLPVSVMKFLFGVAKFLFSGLSDVCQGVATVVADFFKSYSSYQPEISLLTPEKKENEVEDDFTSYFHYFKSLVPWNSYMRLMESLKFVKAQFTAHKSILDFVLAGLRVIVVFLNDSFNLKLPVPGLDERVAKCSEAVKSLIDEYRKGDMPPYDFSMRVFQCQAKLEDLLFSSSSLLEDVSKEHLKHLLRKVSSLVRYCESSINPRNGPRIEPLSVLIGGATGVGKSTMTMPLLLELLIKTLKDEEIDRFMTNHNDFIFYRANENDFWDGYKSHNVAIVYDDFGQRKDTAGSPNPDAWEMIRLKNCAPCHLHFSAIEDKQKHYASPRLLYSTTNRRRLYFESIENSKAVVRRFDVAVIQYPKDEFCEEPIPSDYFNRVLDLNKVRASYPYEKENPETFVSTDVLEFLEWDYNNACPKQGAVPLSYNQMVQKCVKQYKIMNSKGDDLLKFHEWIKQKALQERTFRNQKTENLDSDGTYRPEFFRTEECALDYTDTSSEGEAASIMAAGFDAAYVPEIPQEENEDDESPRAFKDKVISVFDQIYDGITRTYDALPSPCLCTGSQCTSGCKNLFYMTGVTFLALSKMIGFTKAFNSMVWGPIYGLNLAQADGGYTSGNKSSGRVVRKSVGKKNSYKTARHLKRSAQQFQGELCIPSELHTLFDFNTYLVSVDGKVLGQTLFFSSKHFMWPRHFSDWILANTDVQEDGNWEQVVSFVDKYSNDVIFALDFNKDIVFVDPLGELDLHLLYVTSDKIRLHRDLRKHFLSKKDFLQLDNMYDACLQLHTQNVWHMSSFKLSIGDPVTYEFGDVEYCSRDLLYHTDSSPGDCGSPLFVTDPRMRGVKVVGFHTAGATQGMFRKKPCAGVSITIEELDNFVNSISRNKHEITDDLALQFTPEIDLLDSFRVLGKAKQPHVATQSKIVESEFHGKLWEITTRPAALVPFEVGDEVIIPREIARKKYHHQEVYINSVVLNYNFDYFIKLFLRKSADAPHKPRLLTFDEAVKGVEGIDFLDSINRKSSAGYPFLFENGGMSGKSKWFGKEGEIDLSTENANEVRCKVNSLISNASKGIRQLHVFVDCLKDERRPHEKVDKGSTRQFMSCPMDLLIVFKMYFGDFVRHCMQNRIFNCMGLGMDPHVEWPVLVSYMKGTANKKFTAGDYSSFDAKIPVAMGYKVLETVELFYIGCPEEDVRVRRVLFQEIINSRHLSEGILYEFNGGNPSGQPLTAVYNCICNLLILSYSASMRYISQRGWEDWRVEWINVLKRTRFQVFGDDNIIGYDVNDVNWWGQQSLEQSIPKYTGMTYTNEAKSCEIVSNRDIKDITFLKRGFRFDGVRWRAPLDIGVCKETLNWKTKTATKREMELRVEAVLMEIAQHGRDVYDTYAPRIVARSMELFDFVPGNRCFESAVDSLQSLSF